MSDPYGPWATTYDQFEGRTSVETWRLGIVPEVARLSPDGACRVLDVGAGTGVGGAEIQRALPEAHVTSLERSSAMIDAGSFAGPVVQADMTSFKLGEKFDFIVSGFDALNYVPPSFLGDFFDCAHSHLEPGGHVVFDYSSPKVLREDWGELDYVSHTDHGDLARSHRWDESTQRSVTSLRFLRDGQVLWDEVHVQYALDGYALYRVLSKRGFEVALVRNIDSATYAPSCTTHVWVVVKS